MPTIEIRRIAVADAAALRQVRLAALADAPSAFGSTYARDAAFPSEEWTARAAASSEGRLRSTFLAVRGDEPVGIVGGYRESVDAEVVELVSMWTAPDVRRCGLGRRLVATVVDWARETGAASVGLWVTRGNEPAEGLYAAMGFVRTGAYQPLPSDPCKDEIRMERLDLA